MIDRFDHFDRGEAIWPRSIWPLHVVYHHSASRYNRRRTLLRRCRPFMVSFYSVEPTVPTTRHVCFPFPSSVRYRSITYKSFVRVSLSLLENALLVSFYYYFLLSFIEGICPPINSRTSHLETSTLVLITSIIFLCDLTSYIVAQE